MKESLNFRTNRHLAAGLAAIGLAWGLYGIFTSGHEYETWGRLMYFTIWTNVVAVALFTIYLIKTLLDIRNQGARGTSNHLPRISMLAVASLIMMAVSYWALLAPTSTGNLWTLNNLTTHGLVPLLFVVWYYLFGLPGAVRPRDIAFALLLPLAYLITTFAAYAFGYVYTNSHGVTRNFPYFFLDYQVIGWGTVMGYIVGMLGLILLTGWVLFVIDRRRAKRAFLAAVHSNRQPHLHRTAISAR